MPTKPQGAIPTQAIDTAVRRALTKALGASNMQDRALGHGRPKNGALVGKQNAVWANVVLTSATVPDPLNVDVAHNLGAVPVVCNLVHWENANTPDVFFIVRPVNQHKWTRSSCTVAYVKSGTGNVDGTVLTFMVGGE